MTKDEALDAVLYGTNALEMMLGLWEEFFPTSSALKYYKPRLEDLRKAYHILRWGEEKVSNIDYSKVPF